MSADSAIERLIEHHADHHQNLLVGPSGNDAARAELAQLRADLAKYQELVSQMQIDYVALEVAHDALEVKLKQYQRMAARR